MPGVHSGDGSLHQDVGAELRLSSTSVAGDLRVPKPSHNSLQRAEGVIDLVKRERPLLGLRIIQQLRMPDVVAVTAADLAHHTSDDHAVQGEIIAAANALPRSRDRLAGLQPPPAGGARCR